MDGTLSGRTIGKYTVEEVIGKGGMGTVYLARHNMLGQLAAIKVLRRDITTSPALVRRFFLEAKAVAKLRDPGLTHLYDYGHDEDGRAYIIMEYLEGETVRARIKRSGPLNQVDMLRLMAQAARTLGVCHDHGVVHRDLKPDNIFIVRDPIASSGESTKILDFGVAKLTLIDKGQGTLTQAAELLGTPYYMAPEQWQGANLVDARADIYSLGCIMFRCLTGSPPFVGDGIGKICAGHLAEEPTPPSVVRPATSRPVDEVVLHCLEKEPQNRPQTMAALVDLIHDCMAEVTGMHGGMVHSSPSHHWPPSHRNGNAVSAVDHAGIRATAPLEAQSVISIVDDESTQRQEDEEPLPVQRQPEPSPASGFRGIDSTIAIDDAAHLVQAALAPLADQALSAADSRGVQAHAVRHEPTAGELHRRLSRGEEVQALERKRVVMLGSLNLARPSPLSPQLLNQPLGPAPAPGGAPASEPAPASGEAPSSGGVASQPIASRPSPNVRASFHSYPEPPTQELPISGSYTGVSNHGGAGPSPEEGPKSGTHFHGPSIIGEGPPSFNEKTPFAIERSLDFFEPFRHIKGSSSTRKGLIAFAVTMALIVCVGLVLVLVVRVGDARGEEGEAGGVAQAWPPGGRESASEAEPSGGLGGAVSSSSVRLTPSTTPVVPSNNPSADAAVEPEGAPPADEPASLIKKLYRKALTNTATEDELRMLRGLCMVEGDKSCRNMATSKLRALRGSSKPKSAPKPLDIY